MLDDKQVLLHSMHKQLAQNVLSKIKRTYDIWIKPNDFLLRNWDISSNLYKTKTHFQIYSLRYGRRDRLKMSSCLFPLEHIHSQTEHISSSLRKFNYLINNIYLYSAWNSNYIIRYSIEHLVSRMVQSSKYRT